MTQTVLNNCQACWLIQLASHDFIIHYCKSFLNSVNESLCQLNYLIEHENVENFFVDKLMLSFVNKLATAVTRAGRQYSVTDSDSQAESLIEVLSLQATT